MKSFSNALIAAALLAGGATLAAPMASAAKKEKEQKGAPALKLSNEVRTPAAAAQTALGTKDYATATTQLAAAEAAAKTDDDRYLISALRLQMEQQKIADARAANQPADESTLKAPLDALIANPKTPATDLPKFNFVRGVIAANGKNSAEALTFFERARQLGYNDPGLPLQMVKLKMDSGDVAGGSAELEKAIDAQIAAGQKPDESLFRYAIGKTLSKGMAPQTHGWLKRWLTVYPTSKNWRDSIVIYGLQRQSVATLDKAQKVDLYRLMRSAKALADQYDYETYGQWANDLGLPYETKLVISEGKANGKIPAGSASANDLLRLSTAAVAAEGSLAPSETKAKAAANGRLAAGTGDAYLGSGNWAKAIEMYRLAQQKGGIDADAVNTRLGIALANSGDKAGAKTAFEAVKTAPRDGIAGLWLLFLEHPPVA